MPGIWYAGSHGFELIGPDGSHHQNDAAPPLCTRPGTRGRRTERTRLAQIPGVRVEHKRYAVAVHYRNVAPERVGRDRRDDPSARTAARPAGDRRPQGRRAAARYRLGQGHRAGLDPRSHRPRPVRLLPIYIGDDLTDEDAFDAIRFNGIGIVVRHDEDGDRPTAAQFTLNSPDRGARVPAARAAVGWHTSSRRRTRRGTYTFDGYDPHSEKLREALCTVGNGYFATRGAAPESQGRSGALPGHLCRRCVQPPRRRRRRAPRSTTRAW